jgi:exodeoxyribonuclease VIII
MKPGIYRDMPPDEYLALDAISRSDLMAIAQCPAYYKWLMEHPEEETDAQRIGTALHTAILEPERFKTEYAIGPDVDKRTTAGKNEWTEFERITPQKTCLRAKEGAKVMAIANAVRDSKSARGILQGPGDTELTLVWEDPDTGVLCKARPDRRYTSDEYGLTFADFKSGQSSRPKAVLNAIGKYGYHIQGAMAQDGWRVLTGEDSFAFVLVVYEKSEPYLSNNCIIAPGWLNTARREYNRMLRVYAHCKETDKWGDTSHVSFVLEEPAWYKPYDDQRHYLPDEVGQTLAEVEALGDQTPF